MQRSILLMIGAALLTLAILALGLSLETANNGNLLVSAPALGPNVRVPAVGRVEVVGSPAPRTNVDEALFLAVEADLSEGEGRAACDPDTGTMIVKVEELCAGDCVQKHEAQHVQDRASCCAALNRCITGAAAAEAEEEEEELATRKECIATYNQWRRQGSDWTECNADKREIECLGPVVKSECDRDCGTACSVEVESALREAEARKDKHCKSPKEVACPFK